MWAIMAAGLAWCMLMAPAAQAGVRSVSVTDPPDPQSTIDLAQVDMTVNNSTGALSLTVRLHRPLPDTLGFAQDILVDAVRQPDDIFGCSSTLGEDGVSISFSFGMPDGKASVWVKGRSFDPAYTISPDRMQLSLSLADPSLVGLDMRCMQASEFSLTTTDRDQVGPVRLTADPQSVPACRQLAAAPALGLDGLGPRIAWGREALFDLRALDLDDYAGYGQLIMQARGASKPFFQHTLREGDEQELKQGLTFLIRLDRGDPPATVTARWLQYAGAEDCLAEDQVTARGFTGHLPKVKAVRSGRSAMLRFNTRGQWGCSTIRRGRVQVRVGRAKLTLTDPCSGRWRGRRPRLRGVSVARHHVTQLRLPALSFRPTLSGNRRRSFAVVVQMGKRVLLRRTLVSRSRYVPAERIFIERDAFVNYCINHNRPIRSRGGRLYCVRPGWRSRSVSWRR